MIEDVDAQVREWLTGVAPDASISFALPAAANEALTLYAYLFDIDRPLAAPSGRLPPIQLRLRYLVTSGGADVSAAHSVLSKVIWSAETDPRFTLEFGPAAAEAWKALELPARAGFVLRVSAVKERTGSVASPVRGVRIDSLVLEPLVGRVITRDGTPVAGAIVEAPSIGRDATTDANGYFTIAGATNTLDLTLRARTKNAQTEALHPAGSGGDYTISVDLTK